MTGNIEQPQVGFDCAATVRLAAPKTPNNRMINSLFIVVNSVRFAVMNGETIKGAVLFHDAED